MADTVLVPLDVEALILEWLRGRDVDARAHILTRSPGMVRVSRTGGIPIRDRLRDQPELLIECWGAGQADSFDLAQRVYGLFMVAAHYQVPEALGVTRSDPSPPVSFPDPHAPELYRHQFTVSMTTGMGEIEV